MPPKRSRTRPRSPATFRLAGRQPPVTFDDLALMLEIDLALGHARDFRRRLRHVLNAALQRSAPEARRKNNHLES